MKYVSNNNWSHFYIVFYHQEVKESIKSQQIIFTVCGKGILSILIGIKFISLPVSILYSHVSIFVFNFAIIHDLTLWKIFERIMSNFCVATSLS